MVTKQTVQQQLRSINARIGVLAYREANELVAVLLEGEVLQQCVVGMYHDAVSLFCVTNLRVIVIDKRPLFVNIEDVRYDLISEVDFGGRLIDSSITMHSFGKAFRFTSWQHSRLRSAYGLIQQHIVSTKTAQPRVPMSSTELRTPLMWQRSFSKFGKVASRQIA
jgi:hypothetical protein